MGNKERKGFLMTNEFLKVKNNSRTGTLALERKHLLREKKVLHNERFSRPTNREKFASFESNDVQVDLNNAKERLLSNC